MKLIFLDVDGVLNYDMCKHHVGIYYGVDPEKVSLLKQIVDATSAKLILSSTWRRNIVPGMPLACQDNAFAIELMGKLKDQGLKLYDYTPADTDDKYRARQIKELIKEYRHNGQQIDGWVVLDDDLFDGFMDRNFKPHFVHTNYFEGGLSEDDVAKAIAILNQGDDK